LTAFEPQDLDAIALGLAAIKANPKLTEVAYVPSKNYLCFQYTPERSARTQPGEEKTPEQKETPKA
jgi:hypothetical protein